MSDGTEEGVRLVQSQLAGPASFGRFPEFSPAQLSALLIQKEIRRAKKNSYRMRARANEIRKAWQAGKGFVEIAAGIDVLPMAIAYSLREGLGYTRKQFQQLIARAPGRAPARKPKEGRTERVIREIAEAMSCDWLHSSWALQYMKEKGEAGETAANGFLRMHALAKFKTENEQDRNKGKTPDFLFDGEEIFPGTDFKMHWFESKATFGTLAEVKEDNRSQVSFYTQLFGPGAIVYWLGLTREAREFLSAANGERSILVLSGQDLADDIPEKVAALLARGMEAPK